MEKLNILEKGEIIYLGVLNEDEVKFRLLEELNYPIKDLEEEYPLLSISCSLTHLFFCGISIYYDFNIGKSPCFLEKNEYFYKFNK